MFPALLLIRNSLKVVIEGESDVQLFPEEDEPTNILNIKRGIVSALMVPSLEEDKNNKMVRAYITFSHSPPERSNSSQVITRVIIAF